MLKNNEIAVIGLGLIGGSILKALKPKDLTLVGISRSEETLRKAAALNIADEYSNEIKAAQNARVVFICTPINKVTSIIDEVRKITAPNCIITDVASIKGFIMDFVNDYKFPTNFIGGHPMAGTENKGIDHAVDNLFDGAKWVLTPSKWTEPVDTQTLTELIHFMGAKTIIADPYEHDKAVTLISHLPLILSQALFGIVSDYPDESIKKLALKLAASGFRDTTRLAATNPEMAKDILFKNKALVRDAVSYFKAYLADFECKLDINEEEFLNIVENLAQKRKDMYSKEGKNLF